MITVNFILKMDLEVTNDEKGEELGKALLAELETGGSARKISDLVLNALSKIDHSEIRSWNVRSGVLGEKSLMKVNYQDDYTHLAPELRQKLDELIKLVHLDPAKGQVEAEVELDSGSKYQLYAYPHGGSRDTISWGLNSVKFGVNIGRGLVKIEDESVNPVL